MRQVRASIFAPTPNLAVEILMNDFSLDAS
jgi:hypothetical protein